MKQGVFLERDGILNSVRVERQHQVTPLTLEDFKIIQDAIPLVKKLKAAVVGISPDSVEKQKKFADKGYKLNDRTAAKLSKAME